MQKRVCSLVLLIGSMFPLQAVITPINPSCISEIVTELKTLKGSDPIDLTKDILIAQFLFDMKTPSYVLCQTKQDVLKFLASKSKAEAKDIIWCCLDNSKEEYQIFYDYIKGARIVSKLKSKDNLTSIPE